jgi:hypothetical protein
MLLCQALIVCCPINSFAKVIIPVEVEIQGKDWIPHQVQNDDRGHFYAGVNKRRNLSSSDLREQSFVYCDPFAEKYKRSLCSISLFRFKPSFEFLHKLVHSRIFKIFQSESVGFKRPVTPEIVCYLICLASCPIESRIIE